jgi:hypothetical protein
MQFNSAITSSVCATPRLECYIVVPTNSPQGTYFSALLGTTYITVSTLDVITLPVIDSNVIFQEVGYLITFEKVSPLLFQVAI